MGLVIAVPPPCTISSDARTVLTCGGARDGEDPGQGQASEEYLRKGHR
jgi:hypothetical protein